MKITVEHYDLKLNIEQSDDITLDDIYDLFTTESN